MGGFEKEKVGNILWSSPVCNQVIPLTKKKYNCH